MQTLEALRILKTRLAAIDEEHNAECASHESDREAIGAKAEAQALSAIFDFLKECKIPLPDSLLRIFRGATCVRPSTSFQITRIELKDARWASENTSSCK
jgi:hypothetical protein